MTEDQRTKLKRGVALFDFDGTLIPWDSQVLFADFVIKREPWRRIYLGLFAMFLPFARILGDEGMKRVFLSYLVGVERETLREWSRQFVAERVMPMLHGNLRERLERHRQEGHLLVMASASPDFYMEEVSRALGFDVVLATQVKWEGKMPLFPDLVNHKGAEKVRRFSEVTGCRPGMVWPRSHGYTDSSADLPMMDCCEAGAVVNPSERLHEVATSRGWEVFRPALPWRNKRDKALAFVRAAVGCLDQVPPQSNHEGT